MTESAPPGASWDAANYNRDFAFVWEHGRGLIDLLDPQPGERVLDLGCGTGHLAEEIRRRGAAVTAIDRDADMLAEGRAAYPEVTFVQSAAEDFAFPEPFDAVFSNAVLHWVKDAAAAAHCVAAALRPGGRFVAEFGGHGNVERIVAALEGALRSVDAHPGGVVSPWYYPSIAEYGAILEEAGIEPRFMTLYDRPTPLEGGEEGMRRWVRMFGGTYLGHVRDAEDAFLGAVEASLRPTLFDGSGWTADYRRLRLVGVRL